MCVCARGVISSGVIVASLAPSSFFHCWADSFRETEARRNRMIMHRLSQIASEKEAHRMAEVRRHTSMSPEEKDVEEEAQFLSRAQGSTVDVAASTAGMAMRIPSKTGSGRLVYNRVTNEVLLEEEKRLAAAARRNDRMRRPASEPIVRRQTLTTPSSITKKKRLSQPTIFGVSSPSVAPKPMKKKPGPTPKPKPKKKRGRPAKAKVAATQKKRRRRF